ncbi:MAG TPA: hypothetical protein VMV68_02005, partial [Spirochaetia bacterium]|nr:hypothetical protein [Spirochaetia bacterium]
TSFHREQYKLEMRRRLFEGSPVDANEAVQNREESVRKLKLRFAHLQSQGDGFHVSGFEGTPPYYPELINEILDEDFSEYAENLQQGVLDKLAVREAEQEQKPLPPLKPLLLEGVRLLSVASAPLEAALQKLAENGGLLTERKVTFGERIRRWFTGHAGSKEEQTYDIEITDPTTAIMSTEKLDFKAYSQRALRRCRILASLSNRMTESYTKIEELDEVKLDEFLAAGIDDVHYVFTRMPPLETYFKSELSRDERVKLKGIKLELNAIKNALVKANQKRHEYVSRREEREQLKRLGIDAER